MALRDLTTRFRGSFKKRRVFRTHPPNRSPSAPGISFAATYVPLEAVGGDLYDIWKISDSTYGMFIGDVTGHGLPAAFIGAMTKMALSFGEKTSPEITLNQVNAALAPLMPEGRFVTAALAFYNTDTAELLVARAGHPSPILYRASSGSTELLAAKGLPLGVLPESRYQVLKTTLGVGDKLLFITDGISETSNLSGQMLGDEGLAKEFQRLCPDHSISDCLTELLAFQETYSEGRLVKDDITIIGLERCE